MVRILFWNVHKKDLRDHLCEAVKSTSADIVVLIESILTADETLRSLQSDVSPSFVRPPSIPNRFQLFCRDPRLNLAEIHSGKRVSLRRFSYQETELLLGLVHVVDRRNYGEMQQLSEITLLVQEIRRKEGELGHDRTILIGDFNMNPFDKIMNTATGMNAMSTEKCIAAGHRTLLGVDYHYFYNPMWKLLGDRTPGPSGTYYHANSTNGHYGWNTLDQVLLRRSVTHWLHDVQILTMAGDRPLHGESGRPDKNAASDHFPILLTLK